MQIIGGSCRVSLVVTFSFFPENFWKWREHTNGTWSFYECLLSDGDPHTPAVIKFF